MKKVINSEKVPAAAGPYSHAILANETLYVSGQLGLNPSDGTLRESFSDQTTQAFENLKAILNKADMTLENVVKTTVFLTDMANFPEANKIYGQYFDKAFPARSCIEISKLPMNGLFEIEAVAVKD